MNIFLANSFISFGPNASRYDPEMDGRILLGKVDCTEEFDLCRRYSPDQHMYLLILNALIGFIIIVHDIFNLAMMSFFILR